MANTRLRKIPILTNPPPLTDPKIKIQRLWWNDFIKELDRQLHPEVVTFTSGDGTPSVIDNTVFKTAGTTAITDFDDGKVGQTIVILRPPSNVYAPDILSVADLSRRLPSAIPP